MLEILYKVSFFLSMLVAYAYVTSTSKVILVILGYSVCVFSYYYFNIIQSAIDAFLRYFSIKEKFDMNSPSIPSPYGNAVESASFIKYPSRPISNYRFDKSTLRHLSKVPRLSSTPSVRIAPPEPIRLSTFNDRYIKNELYNEEVKEENVFQVLKDISRKRNFEEEFDRHENTPKKFRRNELRHFISSHHKRTYENGPSDDSEDSNRKKRCNEADRSVAEMMSRTSSLSVLVPDIIKSGNSKKRKSSKISKSFNESPENAEKVRRVCHNESQSEVVKRGDDLKKNSPCFKPIVSPKAEEHDFIDVDETDICSVELTSPQDAGEYVRVAGGKILNRTNCTFRKKLNSSKINPESVITLEPELVNGSANDIDDEVMKENLLKNLLHDIECKGEKDEPVIFYENSIVEEIAKNKSKLENEHQSPVTQVTSLNSLLSQPTSNFNIPSPTSQPTTKIELIANPGLAGAMNSFSGSSNSPKVAAMSNNNVPQNVFNLTSDQSRFTFGKTGGFDTVDASKMPVTSTETTKNETSGIGQPISNVTPIKTTADTIVSSPKNTFGFPAVVSMAPSNSSALTTSVSSSSFKNPVSSSEQQNQKKDEVTVTQIPISFASSPSTRFKFESLQNSPSTRNDVKLNAENKQQSSVSNITMFGNTSIVTPSSTNSSVVTPAITASFNAKSSNGFQFGQTAGKSGGFSFGNNEGFDLATQTTTAAATTDFSTKFNTTTSSTSFTTSTSAFSSTTPSFSNAGFSSTTPAFGAGFNTTTNSFNAGSTPSFGMAAPSFNPATTASTYTGSTPSFGGPSSFAFNANTSQPQGSSFGTPTANSFGTTQASTFSNVQPSTLATTQAPAFGNSALVTTQTSTFSIQTPATQASTFNSVSANTNRFGSSFTNNTSQFGTTTSQFGTGTSQFGTSNTSQFGAASTQFGATNSTPQFGASSTQLSAGVTPQFGNTTSQFGGTTNALDTGTTQSSNSFGTGGTFSFGANTNTPAFGAAQASTFTSLTTTHSSFNAAPTFNFTAGASSFNANPSFGTAPTKPAENVFNFGNNANNAASQPTASQGMFQFGGATATPQASQPFTFGNNTGTGSSAVGGFSIGSGGGSRTRTSRNRRNK